MISCRVVARWLWMVGVTCVLFWPGCLPACAWTDAAVDASAAAGYSAGQTAARYTSSVGHGSPTSSDSSIERFDVVKGQVVSTTPVTSQIREEVQQLVDSLDGHADTLRVDPDNGTVLRIPLQPSIEIRRPGFYALASQIFLFMPLEQKPYVLVFTEENQPRLFALSRTPLHLLELCGWADAAN